MLTDYGAFRDLQRHRLLTLEWQPLSTRHGYSEPDALREAGVLDGWTRVMDASSDLYEALRSAGLDAAAPYAVAMAYRVRFYMDMNAREAMHVIELRTAPQGHPAYRRVCQQMHHLIADRAGHTAVAAAMTFADHSEVELERLKAERKRKGSPPPPPPPPRPGPAPRRPPGTAASRLAATRGDDEILPAVDFVGGRRGVAGGGHRRLPQERARGLVEGADLPVVVRRRDEDQAAGGDDRAAVVLAAGILQSLRHELGILAERNLPRVLAGIQVDGVERAPRRRGCGIAVRVEELPVAGEAEGVVDQRVPGFGRGASRRSPGSTMALTAAGSSCGNPGIRPAPCLTTAEVRERAPIADPDERCNLRRCAGAIVSMAGGAVLQIQRPPAPAAGARARLPVHARSFALT